MSSGKFSLVRDSLHFLGRYDEERATYRGSARVQSVVQAQGMLYGQLLQRQAAMMAFVDAFWLIAVVAVLSIPLALLLKKMDPAKAHAAAH